MTLRDTESIVGVGLSAVLGGMARLTEDNGAWTVLLEKGSVIGITGFLVWWITGRLTSEIEKLATKVDALTRDIDRSLGVVAERRRQDE